MYDALPSWIVVPIINDIVNVSEVLRNEQRIVVRTYGLKFWDGRALKFYAIGREDHCPLRTIFITQSQNVAMHIDEQYGDGKMNNISTNWMCGCGGRFEISLKYEADMNTCEKCGYQFVSLFHILGNIEQCPI